MAAANDLAVIGAGELGSRVAALWKTHLEAIGDREARVVAVTRTTRRHEALHARGIDARLIEQFCAEKNETFGRVVLCVNFGELAKNPTVVDESLRCWDASAGGVYVYTSSTGVLASDAGGQRFDEQAPVSDEPRAQALYKVEQEVLGSGGAVARLAGLFTRRIGPHSFWVRQGELKGSADGVINMIHYEDAARFVVAMLQKGAEVRGKCLLATAMVLSRREICETALRVIDELELPDGVDGMVYGAAAEPWELVRVFDNRESRAYLEFEPVYKTYAGGLEEE